MVYDKDICNEIEFNKEGEITMKDLLPKDVMAMRAAKELFDGAVVNLGVGIPMLTRNYMLPGMDVVWHSENGAINFGRLLSQDEEHLKDPSYTSAGGQFFLPMPGTSFVDHATSFVVIRGGRLDFSIIGGMQVSENGDLANWSWDVKGRTGGIGGSMDLVTGAKKVICLMTHITADKKPKVLKKCTFPLTGVRCVNMLITNLGVFEFGEKGVIARELAPGWTFDEVQELTEAKLIPSPTIKEMEL
jgi:3-oxoacid CoA-transferase B subunit